MKKIYLQPEIESLPMNIAWALCSGSDPVNPVTDNNQTQNSGDVPPPAPGRKVF